MKELHTEIEIEAPAERVWQILTDFKEYPRWNPFLVSVDGEAREGARLRAKAGAMTFRPVVLRAVPGRELRWLGRIMLPGLFDGEHHFEVEPLEAQRVRFRQSERFRGVLVPLLWPFIGGSTLRGFEAMNVALKERAESQHPVT
jgi:hypothetical protein